MIFRSFGIAITIHLLSFAALSLYQAKKQVNAQPPLKVRITEAAGTSEDPDSDGAGDTETQGAPAEEAQPEPPVKDSRIERPQPHVAPSPPVAKKDPAPPQQTPQPTQTPSPLAARDLPPPGSETGEPQGSGGEAGIGSAENDGNGVGFGGGANGDGNAGTGAGLEGAGSRGGGPSSTNPFGVLRAPSRFLKRGLFPRAYTATFNVTLNHEGHLSHYQFQSLSYLGEKPLKQLDRELERAFEVQVRRLPESQIRTFLQERASFNTNALPRVQMTIQFTE